MTALKLRTFNRRMLYLPLIIGSALFGALGFSQTPQEANRTNTYRVKGIVHGRLIVPPLAHPLKLADENEVPIQLQGYKVHAAYISCRYYDAAGNPSYSNDDAGVIVMNRPDGASYVNVVPEKLGKAQFHFEVQFEDGRAESASLDTEVVFPDRKPEKFLVARGGSGYTETSGTIYMDLSDSRERWLDPIAIYNVAAHPVPIPARYVHFTLIAATKNDPPVSIDESTGKIRARHIGHTLVQATFEDLSVLTCVDVKELASDGNEHANCQELVPAGMAQPLSGFEGKKPPSKVKILAQP
jgi:hypothetical protein